MSKENLGQPRQFSRRQFLSLAVLSALAGTAKLVFKSSSVQAQDSEHHLYLPLLLQEKEIITEEQNKAFYNGLKALRAPGLSIVGDNTGEWGMSYTKATNIGLDLIATMVAQEKGLISKEEAQEHLLAVLQTISSLKRYKGIFPEFIKIEEGGIFAEENNGIIRYSSIDSGWLTTGLSLARDYYKNNPIENFTQQLLNAQDYSIFIDNNGLMGAGFEVKSDSQEVVREFGFSYDNKNSEARLIVLALLGMGMLPQTAWQNMFYRWVEKGGVPIAEGWHFSAFVELTANAFFDEMSLAPASFGKSHQNYAFVSAKIAQERGYKIFGWAPCTNPQGDYQEYGLDNPQVVSPYAAALLATTANHQAEENLLRIINSLPLSGTPLPDALDPLSGGVLNSKALTLDQALFFLAVNKNTLRKIVRKASWYPLAEEKIKEFDASFT